MSNLTSKSVSVQSVVFKVAHSQAKAWLNSGVVFFDSYAQALSFALKKAWAATKGVDLVFGWEITGVNPDMEGLLLPTLLETLVAPKEYTVSASVEVESGVNLSAIFGEMLEEAGHIWSYTNQYSRWLVPECILESRLEVIKRAFYIVEFVVDSKDRYYYYAYYK